MHLLSEFGVDLQQGSHDIGHATSCYDNQEEGWITDTLLQRTSEESWNHHRESHESCAEGIVGRLVLALTIIYKVEHIGREAEAVAKLLDEDTHIDDEETAGRKRDTHTPGRVG